MLSVAKANAEPGAPAQIVEGSRRAAFGAFAKPIQNETTRFTLKPAVPFTREVSLKNGLKMDSFGNATRNADCLAYCCRPT